MEDKVFIDNLAKDNGFSVVGITNVNNSFFIQSQLDEFIKNKFHGSLKWIKDKKDIRKSPDKLWPDAKSAIVFGFNYGPKNNPLSELNNKKSGYVAVYARRKDYHDVLKGRLKQISNKLVSKYKSKVKVFVDTAPLMEKPIAHKAGIGWQGKHTNLVSRKYGSWLLLGVILIDKYLSVEEVHNNNCGSCSKCINICPTKAIIEPYKLDARKCISYLTIEYKKQIPLKYRKHIGNRIFGCDDCLAVCPWNNFAVEVNDFKLNENFKINLIPLVQWLSLDDKKFRVLTSGTTLKRTGYIRMMRNCLIAAGNSSNSSLVPSIKKFLNSDNEILRGSAIWALKQLIPSGDFARLKDEYCISEKNLNVRKEWLRKK